MCGLAPYAEAIVGTLGSEQLKRTTVGVELVAKVRDKLLMTAQSLRTFLFSHL